MESVEPSDKRMRVSSQMIIVVLHDVSQVVELIVGDSLKHEVGICCVVEEAPTLASRALLLQT